MPTIVNGAVGLMLSNIWPPIPATRKIPTAPKKLNPPITAPLAFGGATLPIREMAEMLANISPKPRRPTPIYLSLIHI